MNTGEHTVCSKIHDCNKESSEGGTFSQRVNPQLTPSTLHIGTVAETICHSFLSLGHSYESCDWDSPHSFITFVFISQQRYK